MSEWECPLWCPRVCFQSIYVYCHYSCTVNVGKYIQYNNPKTRAYSLKRTNVTSVKIPLCDSTHHFCNSALKQQKQWNIKNCLRKLLYAPINKHHQHRGSPGQHLDSPRYLNAQRSRVPTKHLTLKNIRKLYLLQQL